MKKIFVDHSIFLGMNAEDDVTRIASKNFFVDRSKDSIHMSFEDIAYCDHVVWGKEQALQDAYYPFMDNVHTDLSIVRLPYNRGVLDQFSKKEFNEKLTMQENLLLSMVDVHGGILYTLKNTLGDISDSVIVPDLYTAEEKTFNRELEQHYQSSLVLRFIKEELS